MTPARLLDEIAACEKRVRAAQARPLTLIAAFAEDQRDGLEPGECQQTERAIGMEVAAALGVSIATARCRVGDADTLTGRLPPCSPPSPTAGSGCSPPASARPPPRPPAP
jgi:hypothetical protein